VGIPLESETRRLTVDSFLFNLIIVIIKESHSFLGHNFLGIMYIQKKKKVTNKKKLEISFKILMFEFLIYVLSFLLSNNKLKYKVYYIERATLK